MNKLNLYLFSNTIKYIFINIILISLFVIFINLIEISRILDTENQNILNYIFLSLIKIPSIINESIPFITIIYKEKDYVKLLNGKDNITNEDLYTAFENAIDYFQCEIPNATILSYHKICSQMMNIFIIKV